MGMVLMYELLSNIITKIQSTVPDKNDTISEEIYRKIWLTNKAFSHIGIAYKTVCWLVFSATDDVSHMINLHHDQEVFLRGQVYFRRVLYN